MKSMKKFGKEGVSEIVGTVLLLAVAIATFSVLAIYVFSSTSPSASSPDLDLVGYINENQHIIIEHKGGEEVKLSNIKITVWKGDADSCSYHFDNEGRLMGDYATYADFEDINTDKKWGVGEYIDINATAIFGNITNWQISAIVIDENSNSVIFSGILQPGILHTVPPVAIFTYAPLDPKTLEIIEFNASQSYDPDGGRIVTYRWDFGDGNIGYGMVVVHKYATSGTYNVTLTVIDDEGQSAEATTGAGFNIPPPINVTDNQPPIADFTWNIDPDVDGKIDFTSDAIDPDGTIISYYWNFGDGSTSSSPNPSHIYDLSGNYTVTLIVTDDNGATYAVSKTITVPNKKPIPVFTYNPSAPNTKQFVFFDASASFDVDGSITNYSWDFENDGIIDGYGVTIYHMFNISGNYTVNLTVTDNEGATNYTTKIIQVVNPETTPSFIIVDNTPTSPRNWDGMSRIVAAVQKLTSDYSTGKAIDSWYFVDGTEVGKRIEDAFLDEFDIVIWSTGDFPGDGGAAFNDGNSNTWTTPMTEGYDDSSNHVYEIYQHLTHNGTLLLTGSYAVRDLQDYPGNGANSDEIWLGNTLGLVEPTGGINESLHAGTIGYFATDYYTNSGTFSYGPIYAHGVINGIPGTSSDGADIVITQDIPLYSLIKQSDTLYEYSLYVTGSNLTFFDNFESGSLTGWTTSYYQGSYPWRVSNVYSYSPPAGGGTWVYHPDPFYGWYVDPVGPYATGYYAYGYTGDWLISPQITVPSGGRLEFDAGSYWRWSPASFTVKLSTTGNTPSDFTVLLGTESSVPRIREHGWTKYTYDLSAYAGQNVYIAIQVIGGDLFIDNFKVTGGGIPSGYYAIDAVRGANRSIVLGFDLNSPYITNESREAYIRNAVRWMAEGLGYVTEVYVDDDAPPEWYDETHLRTIAEGIDAVTLGGTIYVYNGTYAPTLVDKSVNIIALGDPVINAAGVEYGFKIIVDWVTIDGFTIQGQNTQNGILLYQSSSNTIKNCTISGCNKGISLYRAHHNTIEQNAIQSSYYGLYLYYSLDNTINNNEINNNQYGIYADTAFLNHIQNNNILNNALDGVYLDSSENNTVWNNIIANNQGNGIYLLSSTNKNTILENTIYNNTNGVYLDISIKNIISANNIFNNTQVGINIIYYSSQTLVTGNNIWNNTIGISMENASSNDIYGNNIYWNDKGIRLYSSASNNITFNSIYNNNGEGVLVLPSSNTNRIENNTIYGNTDAIYLNGAKGNSVRSNNIYSNSGTAIYLFNSLAGGYGNNEIIGNNISQSVYGIYLKSSSDNTVSYNTLRNITNIAIYITTSSDSISIASNNIVDSTYGIYLSRAHYNTISNNTIHNITEYGISLSSYSSENDLINNTIYNSRDGIHLEYSSINDILNNTIYNNNGNGVSLLYSDLNGIYNNSIYNNDGNGISLAFSDENSIADNHIFNNSNNGIYLYKAGGTGNSILNNKIYGNTLHGIYLEESRTATAGNNEIIGNEIHDNGGNGIVLYASNINSIQQNIVYSNNANGVFLNSSDSNTIQGNEIYENAINGLFFILSNSNDVQSNSISFNGENGISLLQSSQGDSFPIQGNLIWNNSQAGIFINSSSSNYVTHNIIWNNSYGLYMNISSTGNRVYENNITLNTICGIFVATPDCSGNRFYNNNFINNTLYMERQAYDVGGNYWDNGYSAGGNYWSDYTGTDLTGPNDVPDGIGDTPYDIAPPDVGNVDQYPLMEPKKW